MIQDFTKQLCMLAVLAIPSASAVMAQGPTNNSINFEIRPYIVTYDGFSDVSSDGEVVAKIRTTNPDGGWYDYICYQYPCVSTPCTWVNENPDAFLQYATNQPWDHTFDLQFEGMEDDDVDPCNYNPAEDDDYFLSYATWTWDGGFTTSISQNALRWPSTWYNNDNDDTNGFILPNSDIWDLSLHTAWRYTNGDNCANPLTFGTLNFNSNYGHFNSTSRLIEGTYGGLTPLIYTNTANNASADVYYSFVLTEPAEISISTVNAFTAWDTFLRLFNANCTEAIALNDDSEGTQQSTIVVALDPGEYKIQVEGFNAQQGNFLLEIEVGPSTLSLNPAKDEMPLSVYPNPTSDFLNINITQEWGSDVILSMFDLSGRKVYQQRENGQEVIRFSTGDFAPGVYSILVEGNNRIGQSKVVIQK